MTNTQPSAEGYKPPDPEPEPECDLGELDDLQCDAAGIKRQAEVMAQYAPKLEERRKQFDEARKGYATSRAAATTVVKEIRNQLDYIIEQLKCTLKEEAVNCLDQAYEEVRDRLEECRGPTPTGCCIQEPCEFDTGVEGVPTPELRARIAETDRTADDAEACFDSLAGEPKALTDRVMALKADVEALAGKLGGDPTKAEPARTYAEALMAKQRLDDIWKGFTDVDEFVDCLCRALVCSVQGRKAQAILEGELAVRECKDDKARARCDWLANNLLEEILAAYLKLCPPEPNGGEAPTYGGTTASGTAQAS